jgi:hypothetical protein
MLAERGPEAFLIVFFREVVGAPEAKASPRCAPIRRGRRASPPRPPRCARWPTATINSTPRASTPFDARTAQARTSRRTSGAHARARDAAVWREPALVAEGQGARRMTPLPSG